MSLVNQGFVLRAYNLDGTLAKEQSFSGLPIRIGRNALNDFQVDSKTVSNFHARIDYEQGRVRVYDLNSTNGVFTRIPNEGSAERVGEQGAEITGPQIQIILGAQLWLCLHPAAKPISDRRAVTGSVLGNPAMLEAVPNPGLKAPDGFGGRPHSAQDRGPPNPASPYAPPVWATPAPPPPAVSQPIHAMRSIPVGSPAEPGPALGVPERASAPAGFEAVPAPAAEHGAPGPAPYPPHETLLSAGSTPSPGRRDRFTPVQSAPPSLPLVSPEPAESVPPSLPLPPRAPAVAEPELPLPPAAERRFDSGTPAAARRNPLAERLPDGVRVPEMPGWAGLPELSSSLPDLPGASGAPSLPPLPGAAPGEDRLQQFNPRDLGSPASQYWNERAGIARQTGYFDQMQLSLEQLAFAGLRELAASLAPGNELQTSGDIARFITKLHDAIDVFCKSFIPLREGYSQFVSSMDLQRAALRRSRYRSQGYMRVEAADTPEAVAGALLDWTDKSLDSHKAIEGIFADLMIHQVALLDGVMQGVRALLEELSPEKLEQSVGDERLFGINRHKDLWRAYCDRYSELAVEEQAFNHIFGRDFAEAYREYQRRKAKGETQ